jgi:predicted dehydrogenase
VRTGHDVLGAAVVGTGFGVRVHVPALRAAGLRVEALVGRDPGRTQRRAERLGIPHALTSLDDALARTDVDVVTIASPPHEHAPMVLAALAAGKHVICEKPFTLDADEARRCRDAAAAAGRVAVIGHEFRFAPERALPARLLAEGAIGEPRLASFVSYVALVADPTVPFLEWWFDPARGGGWLGASGSHVVDQVRTWFGDVDVVAATLGLVSERDPATHAEDAFTVLLRARASGATVVAQQTGGAWGPPAGLSHVAGTRGSLWLDGTDVWLADREGARVVPAPADLALPPGPPPAEGAGRFTHLELGPYTRLCERVRDAALGDGDAAATGAATFADGVACMEVLDAARSAARAYQGSP